MINLGNMNIADLRLGASQVKAVYLGSEQVWGGEEPVQVGDWVCFTALENNSNIRLDKKQHAPNVSLEYSTDGGSTWSEYTWSSSTGPAITLATTGDKVYFRAKNDNQYLAQDIGVGNYDRSSHWFASSAGKLKVSGNLNTLLSANNTPRDLDPVANKAAFSMLFNECANLYDATELSIPSMVIAEGCYQCLFRKCTNLSAGPLELPATTLASGSYNNLFENCNNILSVPAFPAAQTVGNCYAYMLYNCRKLNSISVGLTAWSGTNQWVNGVAANGTFTCPAELSDIRDGSHIPVGWNVVHPAPDIFYNEAPTRVWYNDGTSAEYNIVGQATTSNVLSAAKIEKIEFGNTVTEIVETIFRNSTNLRYFYTGWNCESLPSRVCNDTKTLSSVVIGPSLKTINSSFAFSGAGPITDLVFHDDCQLSDFGKGAFNVAVSCDVLTIKSRASSINFAYWAFSANGLSEPNRRFVNTFIFDVDVVPTADTNAFANQGFTRGVAGNYAVVPDNLVAQWKTTSPWSNWASNIISMTEYEAIKNNS